jgi:hypothetical protein
VIIGVYVSETVTEVSGMKVFVSELVLKQVWKRLSILSSIIHNYCHVKMAALLKIIRTGFHQTND